MQPQQPQQPLPVPDNFSFRWDSPEQALQFWSVDLMHWPHGLSHLGATMSMPPFFRGATTAANALALPFVRMEGKHIRGYVYQSVTPYSTDPGEMQDRMNQMQARMAEHVPGLLDRWHGQYEPEIRSLNRQTMAEDYARLTDAELADVFGMLANQREREGELHFLAVFPAMAAVAFFEQVYTDLFGEPDGSDHLQLLQGFANKSIEVGIQLWRLAVEARKRPEVMEVLRREAPSAVHAALEQTDQGKSFRGAVDEFLREYGWRAPEMDVASTTWIEDPTPLYVLIREYASRGDYSPEDEFQSLRTAREARERAVLNRVGGGEAAGMFEMVLRGAQQYLPIQENHNFWIDQQGGSVPRVPALEAGHRLVASGRITSPDDVFQLKLDELQEALRSPDGSLQALVAQRRREQEENLRLPPPPALGTQPVDSPHPMFAKFRGDPPELSADPRIIKGNPASAGKVTATARVLGSMNEAARLGTGEVLVCPATMPVWTPLFAIASAVVTDHGGVLSHTAIVAREYRIPAVLGTKVATSLVRDGQTVTVDGTGGTVTLED